MNIRNKKLWPLLVIALFVLGFIAHSVSGQVSTVVGQVLGVNYTAPTTLATIGGSGLVTNPSGLIAQVAAGPIICGSVTADIPPLQMTLLANTSYIIVYNCSANQVYARTGVVGPGSATGSPGVPNTILVPSASEVPLATVVAGASSLTVTDARVPALFPPGESNGNHLLTPAANSDTSGSATLASGTKTVTFTTAWQSAPICVVTWNGSGTFTTGASLKAVTTTTTLVITSSTGTDTAVVNYVCAGNPN